MPWYWQEVEQKHIKVAIWRIEESEAYFLQNTHFLPLKTLATYKHPQARLHWLASRLLLYKVLGAEGYRELAKNDKGKPLSINNNFQLSISHAANLVVVAIAPKAIEVGIDIQDFSSKLEKIAPKFIQKNLLHKIMNSAQRKSIIHIYWGIKEALFKAYGKGKLDFKNHIHLNWDNNFIPKGETFKAYISKNDQKYWYLCEYLLTIENYVLCVVTKIHSTHYVEV